MKKTMAYSAASADSLLKFDYIQRREVLQNDVAIEILFCGICHSDIHTARNEWSSVMGTTYPCVPGHEIVGRVSSVGAGVTGFKPGDLVGVGCLVDSDHDCPACDSQLEQFCPNASFTYNSPDRNSGGVTFGGYSANIVVDQSFVLDIPENLDPAGAAPLLCAGITTYSPMKRWGDIRGKKVGIVGLGGLGHMGVKFARAFGAQVYVFSRSEHKREAALELGANELINSTKAEEMQKHMGSFDFILDTISAEHDINAYISMLGIDGEITMVGAPEKPLPVSAFALLFGRKKLTGSLIGGIRETQEMLDFCGQHGIISDVEVIPIQKVNEAYERVLKSDVKYRFSIDLSTLSQEC